MGGHNLVAVYYLREDAERVRDRLIALGIPATDIRLSSASDDAGATAVTQTVPHERRHSFWDWLFGEDVPEHDRVWYHANLREGRTALSVLVRNDAEREQVENILEEFNPLDLHDETTAGHCQLKRPWYAHRVGGAALGSGKLLCSPIMLPRSSDRGRKKAPWVR